MDYRDRIIKSIRNYTSSYLKQYEFYDQYILNETVELFSRNCDMHRIIYNFTYRTVGFEITLIYDHEIITSIWLIDSMHTQIFEITAFYSYVRNMPKDHLTKLFSQLSPNY